MALSHDTELFKKEIKKTVEKDFDKILEAMPLELRKITKHKIIHLAVISYLDGRTDQISHDMSALDD